MVSSFSLFALCVEPLLELGETIDRETGEQRAAAQCDSFLEASVCEMLVEFPPVAGDHRWGQPQNGRADDDVFAQGDPEGVQRLAEAIARVIRAAFGPEEDQEFVAGDARVATSRATRAPRWGGKRVTSIASLPVIVQWAARCHASRPDQ